MRLGRRGDPVRRAAQPPGLTFDAGALLALERRGHRIGMAFEAALASAVPIHVPAPVIVAWWRGRTDARDRILRAVVVEPLTTELARVAGEAIAAVGGATPVDAVVMASAARRGDIVYTSDVADLRRLAAYFPAVRVLGV